jgi:cytochrome P450
MNTLGEEAAPLASVNHRCPAEDNPEQIEPFIDEIVRLEPPGTAVRRWANEDVIIFGCPIPAGSRLSLCVPVIGREAGDEVSVTDDGRIRRKPSWGFGVGRHRCPASGFVRMRLAVLLTEWLGRIPEFELEPGFTPRIVNFRRIQDELATLPLRWSASGVP